MKVVAREKIDFAKLSAYEKGYAVYWLGANPDYPEIPETYTPTTKERSEFNRGQQAACLAAQDSEE